MLAVTIREQVRTTPPALKFVLMVGIMSFFADFTYEGSRSIAGPYLGMLGAGAFTISVVSGAGEFAGYNIRLFSGRSADRTGRYWPVTIGGYILQMSVVPLLALAGTWQVAALLIIPGVFGREDEGGSSQSGSARASVTRRGTQCCPTRPPTSDTGGRSGYTRRLTSSAPCSARC